MSKSAFIPPMLPRLAKQSPQVKGWLHEVKFDGWRLQLHKHVNDVRVFSKKGHDFTGRFPDIEVAFLFFPATSVIIDAELTACNEDGLPDFGALLRNDPSYLCIWAFDIMWFNGKDLRPLPLDERKAQLHRLVQYFGNDRVRYSDHFEDASALLAVCERMKLEGIVSKRKDSAYVSGTTKNWIKVKCPAWREDNAWRHEFFQKRS